MALVQIPTPTPAASAPPILMQTGGATYWIKPNFNVAAAAGMQLTEDLTYYVPVYLPSGTVDRIACRAQGNTPGTGFTTRLGIYANSSNNQPGNLILDAGTVNPSSANTNYTITISQSVSAGWHWLAINRQLTPGGTIPAMAAFGAGTGNTNLSMPWENFQTTSIPTVYGWTQSSVTGAFANAGTLSLRRNSDIPCVWVRMA